MKSRSIIMQDFSIAGIKKQWEWQQSDYIVKHGMKGGPIEGQEHHFKKIKGLFHPEQMGCKSVTRRLTGLKKLNEKPDKWKYIGSTAPGPNQLDLPRPAIKYDNRIYYGFEPINSNDIVWVHTCPYGVPGDELWVRESFWEEKTQDFTNVAFEDGTLIQLKDQKVFHIPNWKPQGTIWKKKSPLFMPREASRITLIVESVKVERLHDITEEGALMEGLSFRNFAEMDKEPLSKPIEQYRKLWKEMHGEASWDLNPWVWVIGFSVKEFKQ